MEKINSIKNLEKPIILTNQVLNRWINVHNFKKSKIHYDDVRQLVLQYIKRYVITDISDFKRVSKLISIDYDFNNLVITGIYAKPYATDDYYFGNRSKIQSMFDFYRNADYKKYENYEETPAEELTDAFISFDSIKSIQF